MTDNQIIKKLGGVKAISTVLGYKYNTVQQWEKRGISAFAKVKHPEYFMPASLADIKPLIEKEKKPKAVKKAGKS